MKTLIVLLPTTDFERDDAEGIEGALFLSEESFLEDYDQIKEVRLYELSEFTTACNDQEITLDNYWITYIHI